jgi:hypothetical protein
MSGGIGRGYLRRDGERYPPPAHGQGDRGTRLVALNSAPMSPVESAEETRARSNLRIPCVPCIAVVGL